MTSSHAGFGLTGGKSGKRRGFFGLFFFFGGEKRRVLEIKSPRGDWIWLQRIKFFEKHKTLGMLIIVFMVMVTAIGLSIAIFIIQNFSIKC